MSKLIATTSIAMSYIQLIVVFVLSVSLLLGLYLGSFFLASISFVSITYLLYRSWLYEVKISDDSILISHIFYGIKRYSKSEFVGICKQPFPFPALQIRFIDGRSYSFFPLVSKVYWDYSSYAKYIAYWNKELALQ